MREREKNDVAEEVKVDSDDLENVSKSLDSYGKESGENGVVSEVRQKRRRLCEKEKISGCLVEFVGRVLRSRFASTDESSKVGCVVDRDIPCGNHYTELVNKSSKLMKSNSDDSGVLLETTVKRRRGRPRKVHVLSETTEPDVGNDSLNVVKANSDDSDIVQAITIKRKRGRPPKVNLGTEPSVDVPTKAVDESLSAVKANSDDSDIVQAITIQRKRGRPPKGNLGTKPSVDVPTKAVDESLSAVKGNSDNSDVVLVTSVEGKRGRPFKMKAKSAVTDSEVDVAMKVKGRCSMKTKTEAIETNQEVPNTKAKKKNKKKQGRCPKSKPELRGMMRQPKSHGQKMFLKIQNNSLGQKVVNNLQGKSSAPHASEYDSDPDHAVSSNDIEVVSANVMKERTLHLKRLTSPAKNRFSDFVDGNYETLSKTSLVQLREKGGEKTRGCGKSMEKHLIREQIQDMLLSAGWTIEYRPRMGREYADAIYVSPQGRAYWSATLAYSVLKSHCENIDAASPKVKSEFTFKPIPEDSMKLLARITKKKKESLAKLGLHESDTGKSNRKSGTTKHCMRNAGISDGKFFVDSNGKASRGKSKNAHSRRQRALLVRDSKKGMDGSGTFNMYPGKRTVLNWMIDLGTVPLDVNVHYQGPQQRTRRTHAGKIVRDGISCGCCNEIFALSEFQVHSRGKSDNPSQYIYLEDGTSLLQCQLLTWDKQGDSQFKGFHSLRVTSDDPNDDSCGICGNGGELICCDGCTSTFHLDCLNMLKYPTGEWHCLHCSCKFCGQVGEDSFQENVDEFETFMLSTCHLCEAKYHKLCIQTNHAAGDAFDSASFCGTECQKVLKKLMSLLGVKHELTDGYSWTLLHRFDVGSDSNPSEMPHKVECNSKLAVAFSILDECFLPIIDHRTGIDLIHNVVYNCGSNFTRLNFSGFYTVILEKCDELISAASIRVHGDGLAEMPFIGTRHSYRRQGMCSRLLRAVEDALRSLGVKKLVIPAISELLDTWTSVFGFEPLRADDRQILKNVNLLVFPCTGMLQKTILETRKEQELILAIDASGKQDNLDPGSPDEPETNSC